MHIFLTETLLRTYLSARYVLTQSILLMNCNLSPYSHYSRSGITTENYYENQYYAFIWSETIASLEFLKIIDIFWSIPDDPVQFSIVSHIEGNMHALILITI